MFAQPHLPPRHNIPPSDLFLLVRGLLQGTADAVAADADAVAVVVEVPV